MNLTSQGVDMSESSNEVLDTALIKLIDKAIQGVDKSTQFLMDEIPDVVQQLLFWQMAKNLTWIAILLLAMPITFIVWYKLKKLPHICVFDLTVAASIPFLVFAFFTIVNLFTLVKVWIAPKVWLIDYAASLAR